MTTSIKIGLAVIGLSIASISGMGVHDLLTKGNKTERRNKSGRNAGTSESPRRARQGRNPN